MNTIYNTIYNTELSKCKDLNCKSENSLNFKIGRLFYIPYRIFLPIIRYLYSREFKVLNLINIINDKQIIDILNNYEYDFICNNIKCSSTNDINGLPVLVLKVPSCVIII